MNKPCIPCSETGTTVPMRAESVNFRNGMIVNADDLSAAMRYPVALMQAVNVAVYGCGVVCGFKLSPDPELCGSTGRCDSCNDNSSVTYPNFVLQVGRGTAIDCYGMPIELCAPVRVSIQPETCGGEVQQGKVSILIRRCHATEAPRGDCCAPTDGGTDCSRIRDHIEIRAFPADKVPEHTCMRAPKDANDTSCGCGGQTQPIPTDTAGAAHQPKDPGTGSDGQRGDADEDDICRKMMECDPCSCCGEGWVLIGTVEICKGGIIRDSLDTAYEQRKLIKLLEAVCNRETKKPGTDQSKPDQTANEDLKDQQILAAVREDANLRLMIDKDPAFDEKLPTLVESEAHRKIFKVAGITSSAHLAHYIDTNFDQLAGLLQFAKNPEKLQEYAAAARQADGVVSDRQS